MENIKAEFFKNNNKTHIFLSEIIYYLLFLTCFILPFSFQISTFFFIAFVILSLLLCDRKLIKRITFLDIIRLPSILFLIPFVGLIFTNNKDETFALLVKYLPYLLISISYCLVKDKIKSGANKYVHVGIVIGVLFVILYLFFFDFYKFSLNNENSILNIFSHKYTYNSFLFPIDSHPTYLGLLVIMSNLFVFKLGWTRILKFIILFVNLCGILFISSKVIIVICLLQGLYAFCLVKNLKVKSLMFLS